MTPSSGYRPRAEWSRADCMPTPALCTMTMATVTEDADGKANHHIGTGSPNPLFLQDSEAEQLAEQQVLQDGDGSYPYQPGAEAGDIELRGHAERLGPD